MPKLVFVITEDNILKQVKLHKSDKKKDEKIDYTKIYKIIVKHMMTKFERTIASFKETLPQKADRAGWASHLLDWGYHTHGYEK